MGKRRVELRQLANTFRDAMRAASAAGDYQLAVEIAERHDQAMLCPVCAEGPAGVRVGLDDLVTIVWTCPRCALRLRAEAWY